MDMPVVEGVEKFRIMNFIWKNLYIILIILFITPMIVSSINQSIQQKNPALPFLSAGLSLFDSDAALAKIVNGLENNPASVIGMEKPTSGIWLRFVYGFKYFFVIWKILGLIIFLTIPFVIIYNILKIIDNSSTGKNVILSGVIALGFMFVMNLLMTIHALLTGQISMNEPNADLFTELWWIIKQTSPFHGLVSLIVHIFRGIAG